MKRKFALLVMALLLVVFFSILFLRAERPVEAAEPHQILETSRERIEEAEPGQLIHILYTTWVRPPPADLDSEYPYHLFDTDPWPVREAVEVWIEIGADGLITRWRTQLRSDEGELLQDLFFAEGIETDYFPQQGWASRFEEEVSRYEDERLVMIADFLAEADLFRRENIAIDGRDVVTVYKPIVLLGDESRLTVPEALAYRQRPFIADLSLVSKAVRLDFDRETLLAVGKAEVGWDSAGEEHILSYRTFAGQEVLPATAAETVFDQQVPPNAFQDTGSSIEN